MVSLDAALDAHEVAVRARVDALLQEAERVAVALGEARVALERVEITRATMAEVLVRRPDACAAQGGVFPADPSTAGVLAPVVVPPHRADLTEDALPVEYRRIWFALRDGGPVRAGELVGRLGLEVSAAKVEGLRSKLKRLVRRGWILEPRPGVFALPATV
jgi:hypothetical protein